MKRLAIVGVLAGLVLVWFLSHDGPEMSTHTWEGLVMPGKLSRAHAFLENNCTVCHSPLVGVEAVNCIVCHANDRDVLQRQPTAFHASINECATCHLEHQRADRPVTRMDHVALARIGIQQIDRAGGGGGPIYDTQWLLDWTREKMTSADVSSESDVEVLELALECYTCHANDDRHQQYFGQDCVQCHSTSMWTVPEFRHPSASSLDCAQCHQATTWSISR